MPYIFKESFIIRSNETDTKGSLRPDALTGLLQETAGNHAKKIVKSGYCMELIIKFKSEAKYGDGILSFMANQGESICIHKLFSEEDLTCNTEVCTIWATAIKS
jgi:hypothetical protein